MVCVPNLLISNLNNLAPGYVIHVGTGSDAGRARLMPDSKTGRPVSKFKGTTIFRFGFMPELGTEAADREEITIKEIVAGSWLAFEITVPAWLRVEEAVEPAPAVPTGPAAIVPKFLPTKETKKGEAKRGTSTAK